MSVIKANGAGDPVSSDFYNGATSRSLRMQNARLTRTASSTGNPKKWTLSVWLKRTSLGSSYIFSASPLGSGYDGLASIYFNASDQLHTYYDTSGSNPYGAVDDGSRLYRDLGSWFHLCWAVDAANTIHKIWINNNLVSTNTSRYPPNVNYGMNNSGDETVIGDGSWDSYGSADFDGYMAEINFLDGQYLEPDSFAETKNGVWIPLKDPSLTYGTNGFRLQFLATGTSADSSGIGADTSGQGNHYSLTGLAGTDVVLDNPENNFATMNPLDVGGAITYTEGNLKMVVSSGSMEGSRATMALPQSGKWYWEVGVTSLGYISQVGIATSEKKLANTADGAADHIAWGFGTWMSTYNSSVSKYQVNVGGSGGDNWVAQPASGDVLGIAYDADNGKLWFAKNGTYQNTSGTANPATGDDPRASSLTGKEWFPLYAGYPDGSPAYIMNFGQDSSFAGTETAQGNTDGNGIGDFYYAPPSGYLALCSANLPEPTIGPNSLTQADDYFNTVLYNGDSQSSNAITGVGFQPDWLWIKRRNGASNHGLFDSSRGASGGEFLHLYADVADGEGTQGDGDGVLALGTDGFTVGYNNSTFANVSGATYVAWNWKANGGTTTTNDASSTSVGNIDSVYQANTTAGFSIVTYTGNGTNNTDLGIAHGLGVTPKMVWVKNRSSGTIGGYGTHWQVYNSNLSASGTYGIKNILLNTDGAESEKSDYIKTTSSTTFTIRSDASDGVGRVNKNGDNYIAYVFAEVEGYSKLGKYLGNGNADGTFVFTGFRPAWIMVKRTDTADNWAIYDSVRDTFNVRDSYLYADLNSAEATYSTAIVDFLSNGFKWRGAVNFGNNSSGTYIYMAFAEAPFKYANAT